MSSEESGGIQPDKQIHSSEIHAEHNLVEHIEHEVEVDNLQGGQSGELKLYQDQERKFHQAQAEVHGLREGAKNTNLLQISIQSFESKAERSKENIQKATLLQVELDSMRAEKAKWENFRGGAGGFQSLEHMAWAISDLQKEVSILSAQNDELTAKLHLSESNLKMKIEELQVELLGIKKTHKEIEDPLKIREGVSTSTQTDHTSVLYSSDVQEGVSTPSTILLTTIHPAIIPPSTIPTASISLLPSPPATIPGAVQIEHDNISSVTSKMSAMSETSETGEMRELSETSETIETSEPSKTNATIEMMCSLLLAQPEVITATGTILQPLSVHSSGQALLPFDEMNLLLQGHVTNPMICSNALTQYQLSIKQHFTTFLQRVNTEIVQANHLDLPKVLISYASESKRTGGFLAVFTVAQQLQACMLMAGFACTIAELTTAQVLEELMAQHKVAVILCTPAYAQAVTSEPHLHAVIDAFGQQRRDSLSALLCEGSFGTTALKVVDGHYLIRSYQGAVQLNNDATTPVNTFFDVVFDLSGSQGLGVLPDALDLERNELVKERGQYRDMLVGLRQTSQQSMLTYLLREGMIHHYLHHPLRTASWAAIKIAIIGQYSK